MLHFAAMPIDAELLGFCPPLCKESQSSHDQKKRAAIIDKLARSSAVRAVEQGLKAPRGRVYLIVMTFPSCWSTKRSTKVSWPVSRLR